VVTITMQKRTGEGEEAVIEIKAQTSREAYKELAEGYALLDARCATKNKWLLDAMRMSKELPAEAQMALKQSVDILFGRTQLGDEIARNMVELEAAKAEDK
jgi:hypothetical protein